MGKSAIDCLRANFIRGGSKKNALVLIRALEEELQQTNEKLEGAEAYIIQLEEDNRFLRRQVIIDSLTGIHNRRFFNEEFPKEVLRAKRRKEAVSIIMIDIDNFKRFNDTYGHPKGDEVLQLVALALENVLQRPTDSLSRYGGEELVFILPNTDLAGAQYIAEKARQSVESLNIPHSANDANVVTISLGAATIHLNESAHHLLARADKCLYKAKTCGRNRVYCD